MHERRWENRPVVEALRSASGKEFSHRKSNVLPVKDLERQRAWQAVHGCRISHAQNRNEGHVSHRDILRLFKSRMIEADTVARAHAVYTGQAERSGEISRGDFFCVASQQNDAYPGEQR
jgi:hypothetical protein